MTPAVAEARSGSCATASSCDASGVPQHGSQQSMTLQGRALLTCSDTAGRKIELVAVRQREVIKQADREDGC